MYILLHNYTAFHASTLFPDPFLRRHRRPSRPPMLLFSALTCLSLHSSWRPRGCSQLAGWPALTFPSASHREQLVPSGETPGHITTSTRAVVRVKGICKTPFSVVTRSLQPRLNCATSRQAHHLAIRARRPVLVATVPSDCEQVNPSGRCVQPSSRSVRLGWRIRCSWVVLVDGHHDRAMLHSNNTKPIEIDGLPPRQPIRDQPTPFCHVRLRVG